MSDEKIKGLDMIKTTGDLRKFLSDAMGMVRTGALAVDKGSVIAKLAGQVNESFYSEIKMNRLLIDLKKKTDEIGSLSVK